MRRLRLAAALVAGCSNATTPADGGADASPDVTSDAPIDVALDAPADAGLSVPQQLDQAGKLALWLEATPTDVALGDAGITTWSDRSKNKNDAIAMGASPSLNSAVIAGHDAVHFDSDMKSLTIGDAPSLRFGTDQVHIVAVARVLSLRSFFFSKSAAADSGVYTGLWFFTANGGPTDASTFSLSPYAAVDGVTSVTWGNSNELADGKFHIVSFRRIDATHLGVWVDDLVPRTGSVDGIDVSEMGQPAMLGPLGSPTTPDFSIAEELVLHAASGVVADADVASVHAYLKQKYGL